MIFGGNAYQGGAIAMYPAGVLNLSGGTICGGNAESHGGCIYSQGTINMTGGMITGGVSGSRGGNLYSSGTKARISSSRSATSRVATDCTRPADRPLRIFFHSRGDSW